MGGRVRGSRGRKRIHVFIPYSSGQAEIPLFFLRDPSDPRDSKSPQWPPYTTAAQQYVSLNLKPLEVRRGLRAQTCAFWNRFLPKLLSATGRRVGWGSRECTRRQGLEGGEREGVQTLGVIPLFSTPLPSHGGSLHLPKPCPRGGYPEARARLIPVPPLLPFPPPLQASVALTTTLSPSGLRAHFL